MADFDRRGTGRCGRAAGGARRAVRPLSRGERGRGARVRAPRQRQGCGERMVFGSRCAWWGCGRGRRPGC